MSNIIKSLSDPSLYMAGGRFDCSTQAACNENFPGMKHFLPCDEVAGALTIADRAAAMTFSIDPSSAAVSAAAAGIITANACNVITGNGGNFTAPGTKNVVVLAVGAPATGQAILSMGAVHASTTTFDGIRLSSSSSAPVRSRVNVDGFADAEVPTAALLAANGTLMGWGLSANFIGLEANHFYCDASDAVSAETPVAMTAGMDVGIAAFDTSAAPIGAATSIGNVQVFHLTTMPSLQTLQAALSFMRCMMETDPTYKFVYPGLYGLS